MKRLIYVEDAMSRIKAETRFYSGTYAEIERAIDTAPTIYPNRLASEWISVKDMLPQVKEDVLIYDSHHRNIYKAWYIGDIDVWFSNEYLPQFINITHWMPLPEPPKES